MSDYLQSLIADYERDILGNSYAFLFSNGEEIEFQIRKRNVPHLLGIGRLSLRQVHGKYSEQLYSMIKSGTLTLDSVVNK